MVGEVAELGEGAQTAGFKTGDRAGARECFQKCADPALTLAYDEWHWSRAFLSRMDQDPQWPRWIAAGASQTAAQTAKAHEAK